jgi:hypothetical protein
MWANVNYGILLFVQWYLDLLIHGSSMLVASKFVKPRHLLMNPIVALATIPSLRTSYTKPRRLLRTRNTNQLGILTHIIPDRRPFRRLQAVLLLGSCGFYHGLLREVERNRVTTTVRCGWGCWSVWGMRWSSWRRGRSPHATSKYRFHFYYSG